MDALALATQSLPELASLVAELVSGRQTDRLLRLHTPLDAHYGPDTLIPETLIGSEVLGTQADSAQVAITGYRLEITALSYQSDIPLTPALGQPVLLELLTAQSRTELRPFHGYITRFERIASDGGLTRYKLTIEPWLSLLRHRRDSTIYQDMSVIDIINAVLKDGAGEGAYIPAWKFDLIDPSIYTKRSLTTQYNETDLDFINRLMSKEGLYYWFTHEGDTSSPQLGSHTLVIADHNSAFTENPQASVRYTQSGTVLPEDSIDSWHEHYRAAPHRVETVTWDYRANQIHQSQYQDNSPSANSNQQHLGYTLTQQDSPGQYAYHDSAEGERYARIAMDAIHTRRHDITAAGTVRTATPGSTITLTDHPAYANIDTNDHEATTTFLITRVTHQAHNNLIAHQRHDSGNNSEQTRYRNTLTLIPDTTTYRPQTEDGHGKRLHPKPTVSGQQTAIVVGNDDPIHTDRDHRIKIQYHWQRGDLSHSRLSHPYADDHTAAPGDATTGTWVRVSSSLAPTAGDNWGSVHLPRVGQEVLVDFIDGDIDRPIVIASLYNGQGQDNAAHNQIAGTAPTATANATSWFTGSEDGHNHAATLSGIKTQQLANSQDGTGGYNQLVFDDTAKQSRLSLQQHEAQHTGDSELNLGQLTHQSDNQRLNPTGFGLELKTRHSAAVRAGSGLLISSDQQPVNGMQMDSRPAQAIISRQHELNTALAQSADTHQAKGTNDPTADKLTAIKQLDHSQQVISQQTPTGTSNDIATYSEPHLQLSSPAGILAATATNAVVTAGNTSNLTAEQDISVSSQAQQHHAVKDGIRLFTQGTATDSAKPNQETGISIHAAQGKLSSQSQSGNTHINASKDVYIASTEQTITIAAPQHVLLTSGGGYIKLEGGNIEVHGPGVMAFKGSLTELAGAGSANPVLPELPKTQDYQHAKQIVVMSMEGTALDSMAITLVTRMDKTGLYQATTDSSGVAPLHELDNATQYAGIAGRIEWSSVFADNESATADDGDLEEDPGESSENGREEEQLVGGTAI
ncbi:type VI secretion system Vgr family protein [Sulfuriferula nivalis]|nr:type VI secretion system Vgr family protein [Sulfuriferula nivalis]